MEIQGYYCLDCGTKFNFQTENSVSIECPKCRSVKVSYLGIKEKKPKKPKEEKVWDSELEEYVTKKNKNPYLFCPICGESNTSPIKLKSLLICKDCFIQRSEEVDKYIKTINEFKS